MLGVGNAIRGDDAVGLLVARHSERQLVGVPDVEVREAEPGALGLVEAMSGFDRVILVDAMETEVRTPGRIHRLALEQVRSGGARLSHDGDLNAAFALGEGVGVTMPSEVVVIAIEIGDDESLAEAPSPTVAAAIAPAAALVAREVLRR